MKGIVRGRAVCHAALLGLLIALPAAPSNGGDFAIVISEVHYHPPLEAGGDERLEFIELQNLSDDAISLAGWAVTDGIFFLFPGDAVVAPRGFSVVARDRSYLEPSYGITGAYGDFEGRLSNGSDILTLRNRSGELVDRVNYLDEDPWPENPDGLGPSLERTEPLQNGEDQANWRASIPLGGTPGRRNSTDVQRSRGTVIAAGGTWRYKKGTAEPANPIGSWAAFGFNDTAWSSGQSGFGYGGGDDATVLADMRNSYTTVYIRKHFTIASPAAVESLLLNIVYDDAYVAYLNGTEVARSASAGGTPGTPLAFNADSDIHNVEDGSDSVELAGFQALLRAGDNVLAIQTLNAAIDSSDLSMIPTLDAVEIESTGFVEPAHDLEVNEVFAGAGADEGFVEIHNEGSQSVNLAGYKLVSSPVGAGGYVFPAGATIAAGARRTVTASSLPFALTGDAQWIGLVTPDLRFVDGVETRARPGGRSFGRYPDGDGDTFVLAAPTPGAANTLLLETRVVINEIQYHPPLSFQTAEYVELHNWSGQAVDVSGWRLDKGVHFTLAPGTAMAPGSYLAISGDRAAVESRYGIAGVLGPWTGKLSNSADKIELKDAIGNRVDVVHYADDGAWPASGPLSGPDGHGPSIELVTPNGENNHGSAWLASTGTGTPLARNSRYAADSAPVIRSVTHSPSMPRSADAVAVVARVADEASVSSVRLFSRVDGNGAFTQATMFDDGAHGDGAAGDGHYGATLAARANGTILQFYIEAADGTGHTRRLPSNAPARVCLYQVDNRDYPAELSVYRAVLRDADRAELESRPLDSDVLLDGSFIQGKHVFYNAGIRYRGENSRDFAVKSFHVELNHDEPFEGITNLNLNAEDNHLAHLAADFIRRAGLPAFKTRPVVYTLNNAWETKHGGVYLRVETVDDDFLERVFPGDDTGNLYRGRDPSGSGEGDLSYLGPNPASYVTFYEKKTNLDENDYTDIIALTQAFTTTPDGSFATVMQGLLDVDEWLRYFAVETVLNNQDGAIATDTGEDYFVYRRPSDLKWILIPWDQNENFQSPAAGIFRMGIAAVRRLVLNPAFVDSYFLHLLRYLDGPFAAEVMAQRIDSARSAFSQAALDDITAFVPVREETIRSLIPDELTAGVEPEYFVRTSDTWRFFRGRSEPSGGSLSWTGVSFSDGSWEQGPGGIGYGDGDDRTTLTDMQDNYTTVYTRHAFSLANPAAITGLTLSMRFDDGFVLYLNGTEVARQDITGSVRFDSRADSDHEAGAPMVVNLSSFRNLLRTGSNVIAAVGVNSSIGSSDLTLDPEVYAPAQGSGCGTRLFAQTSPISLGGTAPILETAAVRVNGAPAAYDLLTGRWHLDVALAAGVNTVQVVAVDESGDQVASTSVEVVRGSGMASVSGTLGTTRWTEAGGPYHVIGALSIPNGATLTIDPGVIVYVDPGISIVIRGIVNAAGTSDGLVRFQGTTCAGTWGGMVFLGAAARGTLQYAVIEGASTPSEGATSYPAGVSIEGGARVRFEQSRLSSFSGPAIDQSGGSQLVILDSLIEETMEGIHSNACYADIERVTIRNLAGKSDCIDFDNESSPQSIIRGCLLEDSPDNGVDLGGSSALVEGNTIHGMECKGISIEGVSSPVITGNVIYENIDDIVSKDSATPVLRHNTVTACSIGLHFYEKNAGNGGGHATGDSLVVWGNARSVLLDPLSTLALTFSDIEGSYAGAGNINANPLFVNPVAADFHLRTGSPAAATGRDGEDMGAYALSGPQPGVFVRGDSNNDGVVDVSDALKLLLYISGQASAPPCLDALDVDDSGQIALNDALRILNFLFLVGPSPAAPFPNPGTDPSTGDPYACE